MLKKIVIGILLVTVLGASGTALAYNAINQDTETAAGPEPLASGQDTGANMAEQQTGQVGQVGFAQQAGNPVSVPWQGIGAIAEIDDNGFQLSLQNGENVYIELGPPEFWRNQGVELQVGQTVTVTGSINEGMIHAEMISLEDGQTLQLRSETGQPLWSGGGSSDMGQNAGQNNGDPNTDQMVQVEEWVTIEGDLMAFQGGNMTMSTADGEIVAFQTGQPRFFSDQGVSFQVGDEIVVVGYDDNGQFVAGDITQVSTGMRVMLRDPNGRPLWGGPGNGSSNGNGNGNGGAGSAGKQ